WLAQPGQRGFTRARLVSWCHVRFEIDHDGIRAGGAAADEGVRPRAWREEEASTGTQARAKRNLPFMRLIGTAVGFQRCANCFLKHCHGLPSCRVATARKTKPSASMFKVAACRDASVYSCGCSAGARWKRNRTLMGSADRLSIRRASDVGD